jgi:hypothetical protein
MDKCGRISYGRLWLKKGCFANDDDDDECMKFCNPVILSGLKSMLAFTSEPVPAKMAAVSVVRSFSASVQFKEIIRLEEMPHTWVLQHLIAGTV